VPKTPQKSRITHTHTLSLSLSLSLSPQDTAQQSSISQKLREKDTPKNTRAYKTRKKKKEALMDQESLPRRAKQSKAQLFLFFLLLLLLLLQLKLSSSHQICRDERQLIARKTPPLQPEYYF
jgi:hypothetical protein